MIDKIDGNSLDIKQELIDFLKDKVPEVFSEVILILKN